MRVVSQPLAEVVGHGANAKHVKGEMHDALQCQCTCWQLQPRASKKDDTLNCLLTTKLQSNQFEVLCLLKVAVCLNVCVSHLQTAQSSTLAAKASSSWLALSASQT